MNYTVALVDDHRVFREGLRMLIERERDMSVVAEAADAREAYDVLAAQHADVVVLDLSLPGANGVAVARELLRKRSDQRLLMLSMFLDQESVAQALEAGVLGYAGKEQPAAEVVSAIRTVGEGQAYLAPNISRFVLDDYLRLRKGGDRSAPLQVLTAREREIFDLTVRGFSSEAIAQELCISRRTVETHRSRILHKLHVHSAGDLVRLAARLGILRDA